VISWVSGEVDDLLELYLRGRLVAGARGNETTGARAPRTH
jgi:hypothetical protein